MKKVSFLVVLTLLGAMIMPCCVTAAKPLSYKVVALPTDFVVFGSKGLNNHGVVIGGLRTTATASLWDRGQVAEIETLGWESTGGTVVNDHGSAVLWARDSSSPYAKYLFVSKKGVSSEIIFPEVYDQGGWPVAINDRDQVVGSMTGSDGTQAGFIWKDGELTTVSPAGYRSCILNDINKHGRATGTVGNLQRLAIQYQNGQITYLETPPGQSSLAEAINDGGDTVGEVVIDSLFTSAALWSKGKRIDLPALGEQPYAQSHAVDINKAGVILGSSQTSTGEWHECVWIDGEAIDIQSRLESPLEIRDTFVLNDRGQILCYGRPQTGPDGYFLLDPR